MGFYPFLNFLIILIHHNEWGKVQKATASLRLKLYLKHGKDIVKAF